MFSRSKYILILSVVLSILGCGTSNESSVGISDPVDIQRPDLVGELEVESTSEFGSWYTLGNYQGVPGYSGPMATYTSSHTPVAVMFNQSVYTTFSSNVNGYIQIFVKKDDEPAVLVTELTHTNDPHQNASLNIDKDGYIWVFVSSRGVAKKGYIYKSTLPRVLDFRLQSENYFAYPQPWFTDRGLSLLYTGYEKESETNWYLRTIRHQGNGCDAKVVDGGHYFVSHLHDNTLHVFYNWTPSGNVSHRKNLYYIKSEDGGCTWQNREGIELSLPIAPDEPLAMVFDSGANNVFLSDAYVNDEAPVMLFVTSRSSNPRYGPHKAMLYRPEGVEFITDIGHQYNVGYYYSHNNDEFIVMPTTGIEYYAGGDMVLFRKSQEGWAPVSLAQGNFNYARRVYKGHGHGIVGEGNPETLSPVNLYNIHIR